LIKGPPKIGFEAFILSRITPAAALVMNFSLDILSPESQSELYSWSGGGSGTVRAVTTSTMKKYRALALDKIVMACLRGVDQTLECLQNSLRDGFEEYVNTSEPYEQHAIHQHCVEILVREVHNLFYDASENGYVLRYIVPCCFLTTSQPQREDDMNQYDSEEEDNSEVEDEQDGPQEAVKRVTMMSAADAGRVAAAIRNNFNALIAVLYQTNEPDVISLRTVLGYYKNCYMIVPMANRLVNSFKRQSAEEQSKEHAVFVTGSAEKKSEFHIRAHKLSMEDVRQAAKVLEARFIDLFNDDLDCVDKLRQLMHTDAYGDDWKMKKLHGKVILSGAGFEAIEVYLRGLIKNESEAKLCKFVSTLEGITHAMHFFFSSAVIRTTTGFNLSFSSLDEKLGNFRFVANEADHRRSFLEIDGKSSKHQGDSSVYAKFSPRFSRITSINYILLPKCLREIKVDDWLEPFSNDSSKEYYRDRLEDLIDGKINMPISKLNELVDPTHGPSSDGKPVLRKPQHLCALDEGILLRPSSRSAFASCLKDELQNAFGIHTLGLGQVRSLWVELHSRASELLNEGLDTFGPERAEHARYLLELYSTTAANSQIASYHGDQAAHTNQTRLNFYSARMPNSTADSDTYSKASTLLAMKQCLLQDDHSNDYHCDDDPQQQLPNPDEKTFASNVRRMEQDASSIIGTDFRMTKYQMRFLKDAMEKRHIVLRFSCGQGKTLLHLLLAKLYPTGITVIIVPIRALVASIESTCRTFNVGWAAFDKNVPYFWNGHLWDSHSNVKVVCVVTDTAFAGNSAFTSWLYVMQQRNLINRIVIDEAHYMYHVNFRPIVSRMCDRVESLN
jgi:hypothetical protein